VSPGLLPVPLRWFATSWVRPRLLDLGPDAGRLRFWRASGDGGACGTPPRSRWPRCSHC